MKKSMEFVFINRCYNYKSLSPLKSFILASVITTIIFCVSFMVWLPALNFQKIDSSFYVIFLFSIFTFLYSFGRLKIDKFTKLMVGVISIFIVTMIAMSLYSLELFHADKFKNQLHIEDSTDFKSDFKQISIDQVPIIDLQTAKQLGDKKMGTISALGSQFNVSNEYTLISVKNKLYRVAPLEYQDVFKWFQNRKKGIPGYIKVNVSDPNDVELVQLEKGMQFSPSAYFFKNLKRHIRLHYPSELIDDYSFELDDEGNPYWVITTYKPEITFYNGNDATGVLIVDPITGDIKKYDMDHVPDWVDRVQPAQFALKQLDNWGKYVHGFFNTIIGNKDMLSLTNSFNYLNIDGQTHIFTGMTSVGADNSVNGFALINLKTKKAKFFRVNGADEMSAKQSAEGAVQHLRYKATDPLILNIADKPTYFVSLKDQANLVKSYGFISLENYSIVGIGDTVNSAQEDYLNKLQTSGNLQGNQLEKQEIKGTVQDIVTAVLDGVTHYYVVLNENRNVYVISAKLSKELPFTKIGDEVHITYINSGLQVQVDSFDNLKIEFSNS